MAILAEIWLTSNKPKIKSSKILPVKTLADYWNNCQDRFVRSYFRVILCKKITWGVHRRKSYRHNTLTKPCFSLSLQPSPSLLRNLSFLSKACKSEWNPFLLSARQMYSMQQCAFEFLKQGVEWVAKGNESRHLPERLSFLWCKPPAVQRCRWSSSWQWRSVWAGRRSPQPWVACPSCRSHWYWVVGKPKTFH